MPALLFCKNDCKKVRRKAIAKRSYKVNIMAEVEEKKAEHKRSGLFLAEIFGVFRKKKRQKE